MLLKQSTARNRMILMVATSDHITGLAGLTLTITASKDGGAFAAITPTVTDRGSGWYSLALTTAHTDTLGDLALHITGTAADPTDIVDQVIAADLNDTVRLGLTALPNAAAAASGGLIINGSNSGTVTLAALTVTGAFTVSGGTVFTNAAGTGFVCSSTGGGGHGVSFLGHTTGHGLLSTGGGSDGRGGRFVGVGSAAGLEAQGAGANGHGFRGIAGSATAAGGKFEGSGAGPGLSAVGGSAAGAHGAIFNGGSTSGNGALFQGTGNFAGLRGLGGNGGTSGHGIAGESGTMGGNGLNVVAGAGSAGFGMAAQGDQGGHGARFLGGNIGGDGMVLMGGTGGGGFTGCGLYVEAQSDCPGARFIAAGNHPGADFLGAGTGPGAKFLGGATGDGILSQGGATGGHGIRGLGTGGNAGVRATGGSTGPGLWIVGGSTSGTGLTITTTSGDGVFINPTNGTGFFSAGQGTSKHGMQLVGGTAGVSDGLNVLAGSGGVDIRGDIQGLPTQLTTNTAYSNFEFFLTQPSDHVTGATGITVTAQRSIDGAAFAACANAVTEVSNGIYKIDLAASDLNGSIVTLRFSGSGADTRVITLVLQQSA